MMEWAPPSVTFASLGRRASRADHHRSHHRRRGKARSGGVGAPVRRGHHWLRPGPRRAHLDDAELEPTQGQRAREADERLGRRRAGVRPNLQTPPTPNRKTRRPHGAIDAGTSSSSLGALLARAGGGGGSSRYSGGGDDERKRRDREQTGDHHDRGADRAGAHHTPGADGTRRSTAAGTTVTVNADVLFDVNSSEFTPAASGRLGSVLDLGADGSRAGTY